MAQYLLYRNGSKLAERIPEALDHFRRHIGASPIAVVVNPRNVTGATEILKVLDLAALPVIGNSGVSLAEVWLQEPRARDK